MFNLFECRWRRRRCEICTPASRRPVGPTKSRETGIALTSQRIENPPREYVQRLYTDIRRWTKLERGGHFVMLEEPQLLTEAIRAFFRPLR